MAANKSSSGNSTSGIKFNTLAPVQKQCLEYLRQYISEHGHAPSLREISEHLGVKSPSTAHFHIERLEQKGFLKKSEDGSIEILDTPKMDLGPTAVPLVGVIAAGVPIDAIENVTMIDVPSSMISGRGEVYCLEVSGSSMIEKHICDRDIVVVKKQDHAEDGQVVVALLEDGSATLKTYRRLKNGQVMLIPANSAMKPLTVDHVNIQGKVIGIMRHM